MRALVPRSVRSSDLMRGSFDVSYWHKMRRIAVAGRFFDTALENAVSSNSLKSSRESSLHSDRLIVLVYGGHKIYALLGLHFSVRTGLHKHREQLLAGEEAKYSLYEDPFPLLLGNQNIQK